MGEWERVLSAFYSVALRTFSLSSCGPLFPPSSLSYKYSRFRGTREVTAKRFYLFFYSISIRTFSLSSCGPLFPPSSLSYKYSRFRGTREVKAKRFLTQYHLEPLFLFTPIDIYIYTKHAERIAQSWEGKLLMVPTCTLRMSSDAISSTGISGKAPPIVFNSTIARPLNATPSPCKSDNLVFGFGFDDI